jgi:hypothetical protein
VGLPVSILLIAIGAVLALAVHPTGNHPVSVNAVGWILFGVGLLGLLLTLMWWDRWGWGRRAASVEGAAPARGYGRRRTVVEDVAAPAPGAPVGPPPVGPPPPGDPPPY